jgi:hypothetical protein
MWTETEWKINMQILTADRLESGSDKYKITQVAIKSVWMTDWLLNILSNTKTSRERVTQWRTDSLGLVASEWHSEEPTAWV